MNKNIKNLFATIILSVVLSFFLPWWAIMVAALLTAMIFPLKRVAVFFIPFLAVLFYWSIYCFVLSSANDFILAKKISELLMIGGNPYLLILATGTIGGIATGFSGVLGKQITYILSRR